MSFNPATSPPLPTGVPSPSPPASSAATHSSVTSSLRPVPANPRLRALDALRAVAVGLVLFHHWDEPLPATSPLLPAWLAPAVRAAREAGWIGVDLFFVLSGFLVAGLLFREWRDRQPQNGGGNYHGPHVGRFLVRRGFKIYPLFYVFLGVVVALPLLRGKTIEWHRVWAEIFFVQNYADRLQIHTWSLAVEEHFYLLLPLYLLWLARRRENRVHGEEREEPAAVPRHFLYLALLVLALRVATSRLLPYRAETHGYATHLRLDSLGFGVLLAYWAHFRPQQLADVVRRWTGPILVGSAACLLPAFFLPEVHPFMHTLGFTGLYLGFGGVLLVSLYGKWRGRPGWLVGGLAWVGAYSYGIYLWHMFARTYGLMALEGVLRRPLPYGVGLAVYLAGSVALGWATSRLVERPALALRERLFPAPGDGRAAADAVRRGTTAA